MSCWLTLAKDFAKKNALVRTNIRNPTPLTWSNASANSHIKPSCSIKQEKKMFTTPRLIMFFPELFLWSLILPHQTRSFFCIHSEPFFLSTTSEKGASIKQIFWRARWKTLAKAGETTFTVQPDSAAALCQLSHVSPQDITSHIIHWVI